MHVLTRERAGQRRRRDALGVLPDQFGDAAGQAAGLVVLRRPAALGQHQFNESVAVGLDDLLESRHDVPSSVELRWRSGEHQAALTSSLCRTGPTGSAISRWRAARSVGRCR